MGARGPLHLLPQQYTHYLSEFTARPHTYNTALSYYPLR